MLLFSVISFTAMYLILAILLAYLFIREIKKGAHSEEDTDQKDETDLSTDPFDGGAYHGIS